MPGDESGGVGVLPYAERVRFPQVWELVRVGPGVSVDGAGVGIISRYVHVKIL